MRSFLSLLKACSLAAAGLASAGSAAPPSIFQSDSFRIGTSGIECSAQNKSADPALKSMFDRAFAVVCRDAASSVGKLYILRNGGGSAATTASKCEAPVAANLSGAAAQVTRCVEEETGLRTVRYEASQGGRLYRAEGLGGYDSAIRLGFQSLLAGHAVPGAVEVAVTDAGNPTAFARVQAGALEPGQALSEGYLRNNSGNFAEAAEFFETLSQRAFEGRPGFSSKTEYMMNQALQLSNLGQFGEAASLFERAAKEVDGADPLLVRLIRNFRMIDALNRRDPEGVLTALSTNGGVRPGDLFGVDRLSQGNIDRTVSERLNAEDKRVRSLGGEGGRLTAVERAQLLDAQALQLKGAALRSLGQLAEARTAQQSAISRVTLVRDGKVTSGAWLQAGSLLELATLSEMQSGSGDAAAQIGQAIALYERYYPGSAALLGTKARLAAYQSRKGDAQAARTLFAEVVAASANNPAISPNIRGYLRPYLDLLARDGGAAPDVADEFFAATQLLVRPGVAQTQAVFARELSGGSDEAARLFRQSLNQSRDLVKLDVDIARMTNAEDQSALAEALAAARARRDELGKAQTALLSRLAEFPRFTAISEGRTRLADLQSALGEKEAYYKMATVDGRVYALFVGKGQSRLVQLAILPGELASKVNALRNSVARYEGGQVMIDPFDIKTARALYLDLFGPFGDAVAGLDRLIFEPDGAMLQLPVNLLVMDQKSVDDYASRQKLRDPDEFDFTGVAWLGKKMTVTTSVSPSAFVALRKAAPSSGKRAYLGLGENAVPAALPGAATQDDCGWPLSTWQRPINSDELGIASRALGTATSQLLTKGGFSDSALLSRGDLRDFRIVHFATHGLVTAPKEGCPARPALVTSFAPEASSDGLLSFKEIFQLELNADFIILSACDTAGEADIAATRDAGVDTGGSFALDGLVRAFVAAGARNVVASHWPVPDDFDATKTLITGLFSTQSGKSAGDALRVSQIGLMDRAETSHPYYWSAFAIVGDGSKAIAGR